MNYLKLFPTLKRKIILFLLLFFCLLILGRVIDYYYFDHEQQHCFIWKSETILSPDKVNLAHNKLYVCGVFRETLDQLEVSNNIAQVIYILRTDDKDIEWLTKPLWIQSYRLPIVLWKNNHEIDVYVKSKIRSGTMIVRNDGKVFNDDGKLVAKYPLDISFHYERD